MINQTILENWANDLKSILFDINLAMRNLKVLEHDNSLKFKENYNEIFITLWYQQYFIVIVQLAKFFSNSKHQKRNIRILCNKLQNEAIGNDVISRLALNKNENLHQNKMDILNSVHEVLQKIEFHKDKLKEVNDLRNKVFAHSDPSITLENISLVQLSILVKLANEIYDMIFGKIWDQFFNPNITYKYDFHRMIDIFSTHSIEN